MIKIIGPRGTGKTTKLFELARKNNAMILTSNSRAMREKARSRGYEDVEIIGYGDLDNDDYSLNKNVLVDNADDVLNYLMNKFYSIKVIGYTATIDENEKRD